MVLFFTFSLFPRDEFYIAKNERDGFGALEHYRRVLTASSPYADSALFRIGLFYYLIEDWREAENIMKIFIKRFPTSPLLQKVKFWLGNIYVIKGDTSRALPYLDESRELLSRIEKEKISKGRRAYGIQIGSYREKRWAEVRKKEFEDKGYKVRIVKWKNNGKLWYRVVVGDFESKEDAVKYMKELKKKEKVSCWIVKIWVP